MGPVLSGLIKLQSVENRLRAVKNKLARCRRNIVIQENQIGSLHNAIAAKQETIQLTKLQSDRMELDLKVKEDSMSKLRASLNTAKTNKEYAAVLTQLNTTKADSSKIETQILELLRDIEADDAEVEKLQTQIDEQKSILEQTRKEAEVMAAKYEAEIKEIQVDWHHEADNIPAEQLEIFNRVAETYDGEALSIVDEQGGKDQSYSCGGCFMGITAETVNLLMTKDDILRCPNCTRILVLGANS